MDSLSTQEMIKTAGGFDWGDFFGGMLFSADLVCLYTKNPYPCGAAIVGHGLQYFINLNWY